jgi:hypothetical protein
MIILRNSDKFNCMVGHSVLLNLLIRPLRVGSLEYPERYRNLGAFSYVQEICT